MAEGKTLLVSFSEALLATLNTYCERVGIHYAHSEVRRAECNELPVRAVET